ncbi:MAG: L-histidine N(alpha)-methyltransferase [Bacteroidia bacterium]
MSNFKNDVLQGLSDNPKHLSSKYFYDETGSKIFQEIMALGSYYLTRAEDAVFKENSEAMVEAFSQNGPFEIVEFGAGDGAKTMRLLEAAAASKVPFRYVPIDISPKILQQLADRVRGRWPQVEVVPMPMDYFEALTNLEKDNGYRKVVFFLGSNIGNFPLDQADKFLGKIREHLQPGDSLLLGVDVQKNPRTILSAYDDEKGVTARFNLNLLNRINRELDGDFDIGSFQFYPSYNPLSGEVRSYLLSRKNQVVHVAGQAFEFEAWEPIHTEISRKYRPSELKQLAKISGFRHVQKFTDGGQQFVNVLWQAC